MDLFGEANCCVSPVNKVSEAVQFLPEPNGVITSMHHDKLGLVPQISNPMKKLFWPQNKAKDWSVADPKAACTQTLAAEGFTQEEIDELIYAQVCAENTGKSILAIASK
jgi:crotonobetainyl-CoA:carnitine CoA-transferase CaiB-like acyl-CoA transferase